MLASSGQARRPAAISHIQNFLFVAQWRSLRVFQGKAGVKAVVAQSSPWCPWLFGSPSIQYLCSSQLIQKTRKSKREHLFWHNSHLFSVSTTLLTQTHRFSTAASLRPSQNVSSREPADMFSMVTLTNIFKQKGKERS